MSENEGLPQDVIEEMTDLDQHPEGEQNTGGGTGTKSGGFSLMTWIMILAVAVGGVFLFLYFS